MRKDIALYEGEDTDGPDSNKIKVYERRRKSIPLVECPRVLQTGEPNPEYWWENLADYGFVSPKREFIESMQIPAMEQMGQKWGLKRDVLNRWRLDHRWDDLRARWWARIEDSRQERTVESIGRIRNEELAAQLAFWRQYRQMLQAKLSRGYEIEIPKSGIPIEREFTGKELRELAQTAEVVDNRINDCLGFSKQQLRQEEKEGDQERQAPARRVRYNYTVDVIEAEPEALPEPVVLALTAGDVLEGVVVPSEETETVEAIPAAIQASLKG